MDTFVTTGILNNTVDQDIALEPTFAFSHDLVVVDSSPSISVVYTIGRGTGPLVQLLNLPNVNSTRHPYYLTRYNSTLDMVCPLCTSYVAVLTWLLLGRCVSR